MSEKQKILVVEDEEDLRQLICLHLRREGYVLDEAGDGAQALKALRAAEYDLLIVDWMLPEVSGLDLTRELRREGASHARLPVLMVTARAEAADIVLGLEAGADDYITKPFEIPVLLARVRALLRRASFRSDGVGTAEGDRLKLGGIRLEPQSFTASCDGEPLSLTRYEFKLLQALLQNRGRVLTRGQLIDLVQGEGVAVVDRAIDTHVFGLRKKLGRSADLIETVRGVGYRVSADEGAVDP